MIRQLVEHGYTVIDQVLPADLLLALQHTARSQLSRHAMPAGTGRGTGHVRENDSRKDHIAWLNDQQPASVDYLAFMEKLRQQLNEQLFLGLFRFECHYACYRPGDYYRRHLDAFKGEPSRLLSTVFYLNPDWHAQEGGELLLYSPDGQSIVQKVLPQQNRMLMFMSADFPHEVMPATRERYSIAGWFKGAA